MAPLHKICVWTQIRKIKRKLSFNQSESSIKDLRLIFVRTCVQTQILCNGANITFDLFLVTDLATPCNQLCNYHNTWNVTFQWHAEMCKSILIEMQRLL